MPYAHLMNYKHSKRLMANYLNTAYGVSLISHLTPRILVLVVTTI